MESSFFEYIDYMVLKNINEHDFSKTVANQHYIWVEWMAVHCSVGGEVNGFTNFPGDFHFDGIIN
jgi:hypothetical protein